MKTKQEILNLFPEYQDFWMGMNCGKVNNFILSSSRESVKKFMNKLKSDPKLYKESFPHDYPYNYRHSPEAIELYLKNGEVYLWKPISINVRGYRFASLIIDADNLDFTDEEWVHIQAHTRCGRDKIRFFDDFEAI